MAITWHGPALDHELVNLGPLALLAPLLERLDIAAVIDRHLTPDAQQEFSHGQVLSLLLAARLSQPTALVNVAVWAEEASADLLWGVPADKLNDDRLGRALDAFFTQRHSVIAAVTANALRWAELSLDRLHFDTTHLVFYGTYASSQPRPTLDTPLRGDADLPAAHITKGYLTRYRMIQLGVTSVVDELGALPVAGHCLDGNRNGHTAIAEQLDLLHAHLPPPAGMLMVSDRGTFSAKHAACLQRYGQHVLCAVPWNDYRALYDAHAPGLLWQPASFLSQEQQRRRDTNSTLPHEHYDLAVVRHQLTDPDSDAAIAARVIFVHSTADAAEERQRRDQNIAKIQSGLEALAVKLLRGHPCSTPASLRRQVVRLMGHRSAAAFFAWQLVLLTDAEQAALPQPRRGCKRATHRLEWTFDAAAAEAASRYDGLSALLTTAPRAQSADRLFTIYKQQAYVERLHHQSKAPLAVRPVFLKSPRRVEALVCLLHLALLAHQTLERVWRQRMPADAPVAERRLTTDSLLRSFRVCGALVESHRLGTVIRPTRLTPRQREILHRLGFPTIAQILRQKFPPLPTG